MINLTDTELDRRIKAWIQEFRISNHEQVYMSSVWLESLIFFIIERITPLTIAPINSAITPLQEMVIEKSVKQEQALKDRLVAANQHLNQSDERYKHITHFFGNMSTEPPIYSQDIKDGDAGAEYEKAIKLTKLRSKYLGSYERDLPSLQRQEVKQEKKGAKILQFIRKKMPYALCIFLLFSCGGGSESATAAPKDAPIYVNLVVVNCAHDRCASTSDAVDQFHRAQVFYEKQLGINITLAGVHSITDPTPERYLLVDEFSDRSVINWRYEAIYYELKKYNLLPKSRQFTLVIDKFIKSSKDDFFYTAGESTICGLYNSNAFSIVYHVSNGKQAAGLKLLLGSNIAHELGHNSGANHFDDVNRKTFMYGSQWAFDTLNVPPVTLTVEEIHKCVTRRSYLKIKQCREKNKPKKCLEKAGLRNTKTIKEIFGAYE